MHVAQPALTYTYIMYVCTYVCMPHGPCGQQQGRQLTDKHLSGQSLPPSDWIGLDQPTSPLSIGTNGEFKFGRIILNVDALRWINLG